MAFKKVALDTSLETKNTMDLVHSDNSVLRNLSLRSNKSIEKEQSRSSLSDSVLAAGKSKDFSPSIPFQGLSYGGSSSSNHLLSLNPSVRSLCTTLPTFEDIQSKNLSFFTQSLSLQSFSSVQQYEAYQTAAMNSLIRHTIYQALAQ